MSESHPRPDLAGETAADLSDVVSGSPSSYHAVDTAATRLEQAGFARLDESTSWALSPGSGHYVVRDGALIAWINPTTPAEAVPGFRVFGSHTDSPAFKLKPGAEYTAEGMRQVGVEIYGGPLLNSWLDRELAVAGRLSLADGTVALARTGPIARIPQLAIHLHRQVNDGPTVDQQRHTAPAIGLADPADADELEAIALFAAFDHEEIGSNSRSGACGSFLADVTERIIASLLPNSTRSDYLTALASSVCVSSDAGHAAHPNYPERHDPHVR